MAEYITWADGAAAGDLVVPTTSKQHAGWIDGEQPPHEYFNWYQNRTDKRLGSLEDPVEMYEDISDSNTRPGTIAIRETYAVPQYRVGSNQLQVYLDGILCRNGETYEEVGRRGAISSTIEFLVPIPRDFQIIARAPIKIGEGVRVITRSIGELETLVEQTVIEKIGEGGVPLYSAAGTRTANIASGSNFTVPSYIVGSNSLSVYIDGLLCIPGVSYEEVGAAGTSSTQIKMLQEVATNHAIIIKIG